MRLRAATSMNDSSRHSVTACGNSVEQRKVKTTTRAILAVTLVGSLALTGCAYNAGSADVYSSSQAQREATVRFGTIESVRAVTIQADNGQPSGLGALGGAALGGVAGNAVGGGRGQIATTIIGALAGGLAGNAVENQVAKKN